MTKELPSPETLRKLLRYEPETGKLFWLPRDREFFQTSNQFKIWNIRFANKEALTAITANAYKGGHILNRKYLAHRVIWAIQIGSWPNENIDHINHDKIDNRWSNIRAATKSQNNANKPSRPNSTSKYMGVCWYAKSKKWRAQIRKNNQKNYLGSYDCEIDAAKAYDQAAREIHGEFANLNFR